MTRILSLITLLCLGLGASLHAAPVAMTVTNTTSVVLPARPVLSGVTWTNGITVAQGQVVKHTGLYYFAETAGVSTNTPSPSATVGLLRPVSKGKRIVATIQNLGSTDTYLSFGAPAVSGKGLKLAADATVTLEDIQTSVSAVTASGSSTLGISEVAQ